MQSPCHRDSQDGQAGSDLLGVQGVNRPVPVIALDVRVHVGPVLARVHAVRALEPRRLTALVLQVPVKPAVPFVRLLAIGAIEAAPGRCVHTRQQASGVVAPSSSIWAQGRQVRKGGQVEHHCKVHVRLSG